MNAPPAVSLSIPVMSLDEALARVPVVTSSALAVLRLWPDNAPRFVYANEAFTQLTGRAARSQEEGGLIGAGPDILAGRKTDGAVWAGLTRAIAEARRADERMTLHAADRRSYAARCEVLPIRADDGSCSYVLMLLHDISEGLRQARELTAAREAAEAANQTKSRFLAHMSHELRTPLNAILGFSEMINKEMLGPVGVPKYSDYAGDIHSSARYLLDIISDILDISRIEAGRVEIEESDFLLADLIEEVRTLTADAVIRRGLRFRAELAEPFRVRADRRLIKQAMVNLVANATHFTEKGGVISFAVVRLADRQLAIVVNDTGVGIPSDEIGAALEPYTSVSRTAANGGGKGGATRQGTGLGLPISKAFMELHGGQLFINSELGAGTSVFLTLPAERVLGPEPADEQKAGAALEAFNYEADSMCDVVDRMTDEELDDCPMGVLKLDRHGIVLKYNQAESKYAGYLPEEVIGRNFFTQVAPCTQFSGFMDRFREGVDTGSLNAVFAYVFAFPKRKMRCLIHLRSAQEPGEVWVFVKWV